MIAVLHFGAGYRTYIIAAVLVLVLIVAVVLATVVVFRAGRKAGAAAEAAKAQEAELKSQEEASDAQTRMLEAGAAAPPDRDALADRLRHGSFSSVLRPQLTIAPSRHGLPLQCIEAEK